MISVTIFNDTEEETFVVKTDATRGQLVMVLNGVLDSLDTDKVEVHRNICDCDDWNEEMDRLKQDTTY